MIFSFVSEFRPSRPSRPSRGFVCKSALRYPNGTHSRFIRCESEKAKDDANQKAGLIKYIPQEKGKRLQGVPLS